MNLIIYVHDFHPEIGHSRAMIELINGLNLEQKNQIQNIEVVSFTCSDLNKVFPEFKLKHFTKVPFTNLRPFIFKMFFYHVYCFIHSFLRANKNIKIGIGIASIAVDITNIQFVHQQWEPIFFRQRKLGLLSLIYKKVLFKYFSIAENYLYSKKNIQFISIAKFISEYISRTFNVAQENIHLIPSAVNPHEFKLSTKSTQDIFNELKLEYPELNRLDINQPIVIFAGAYERKGLDRALKYLSQFSKTQLIIIGKPENESTWKFPNHLNIVRIKFTKKINLFYEISDLFLFPTYYEPFGLVVIEAYAMGLDLIIPRDNIGASEIIKKLPGIYFYNQKEDLPDYQFIKLTKEDKLSRRVKRLEELENISWEQGAQNFFTILNKVKSLK